jgi:Skp family chaperone for outer membrane proteins
MRKRALWAGMALLAAAAPLAAQQGAGPRGGPDRMGAARAPGIVRNIDAALARAEALGLDETRIESLREMRTELQAVDQEFQGRARQFRQQVRDQDAEARAARRAEMQARREQARDLSKRRQESLVPFQERYEALLSVEERASLRQLMREDLRGRGRMAPGQRREGVRSRRPGANRGAARGSRRPNGRAGVRGIRRGVGNP